MTEKDWRKVPAAQKGVHHTFICGPYEITRKGGRYYLWHTDAGGKTRVYYGSLVNCKKKAREHETNYVKWVPLEPEEAPSVNLAPQSEWSLIGLEQSDGDIQQTNPTPNEELPTTKHEEEE